MKSNLYDDEENSHLLSSNLSFKSIIPSDSIEIS